MTKYNSIHILKSIFFDKEELNTSITKVLLNESHPEIEEYIKINTKPQLYVHAYFDLTKRKGKLDLINYLCECSKTPHNKGIHYKLWRFIENTNLLELAIHNKPIIVNE